MADRCKFEKYQYQVSYDSGSTWENVTPIQVRKGDVIEYMSSDCSEIETIYRWVDLQGTFICDGNNKYTRQIREESYDNGATWYASYPTVYQQGTFVGVDEDYCADKFVGHYVYDGSTSICPINTIWNGEKCVRIDPLKVVKCDADSNGYSTLTYYDTQYYTSGYTLISAEIGDCVTSIGSNAFQYCYGLSTLVIPNSVTSIGSNAFYGCSALTSVTINATAPPRLASNAFDYTNNCPIYVPCGSLILYNITPNYPTARLYEIEPCEEPLEFTHFVSTSAVTFGDEYYVQGDYEFSTTQRNGSITIDFYGQNNIYLEWAAYAASTCTLSVIKDGSTIGSLAVRYDSGSGQPKMKKTSGTFSIGSGYHRVELVYSKGSGGGEIGISGF